MSNDGGEPFEYVRKARNGGSAVALAATPAAASGPLRYWAVSATPATITANVMSRPGNWLPSPLLVPKS